MQNWNGIMSNKKETLQASKIIANGGEMILSHFSENGIIFINYGAKYKSSTFMSTKPCGLWLSDEKDGDGWKSWCEDAEFGIERIQVEQKFKVDLKGMIVLDSFEKIKSFHNIFSEPLIPDSLSISMRVIDWADIKKTYPGIIIVPYCWEVRLEYHWYYGWDCSSACVWDLSRVTEVPREITPVHKEAESTPIYIQTYGRGLRIKNEQ